MGKTRSFFKNVSKRSKTTTWIWNLHADAHDFDMQTKSLEDISRKSSVPTLDNLQSFSFGLVECTSMVLISLTIQLG
jgi:hypothetical protein